MMTSRSEPKQLASWDTRKQHQYRSKNPDKALVFHLLLDASPSMHTHRKALVSAYNLYLTWLQQHADPMSLVETRCFSDTISQGPMQPLGQAKPLTHASYNPMQGDGTALYFAIGQIALQPKQSGQHILVTFTDGLDNRSEEIDWTVGRVFTLLKTLQEQEQWLCVFLGAFPEALDEGLSLGFARGNCLVFSADRIPEAFQQLCHATQKYLAAAPADRKLLTTGGIF